MFDYFLNFISNLFIDNNFIDIIIYNNNDFKLFNNNKNVLNDFYKVYENSDEFFKKEDFIKKKDLSDLLVNLDVLYEILKTNKGTTDLNNYIGYIYINKDFYYNIFYNILIYLEFLLYFNEDLWYWLVSICREKLWWLQNTNVIFSKYKVLDTFIYNSKIELNIEASLLNLKFYDCINTRGENKFENSLTYEHNLNYFLNLYRFQGRYWHAFLKNPYIYKYTLYNNHEYFYQLKKGQLKSLSHKGLLTQFGSLHLGVGDLVQTYINDAYLTSDVYYNEIIKKMRIYNRYKFPNSTKYFLLNIKDDYFNNIIINKFKKSYKIYKEPWLYSWVEPWVSGLFSSIPEESDCAEILGGYTYWWAWQQDNHTIFGKSGPGGVNFWKTYIKLYKTGYTGLNFIFWAWKFKYKWVIPSSMGFRTTKMIFREFISTGIVTNKTYFLGVNMKPYSMFKTHVYDFYHKKGAVWLIGYQVQFCKWPFLRKFYISDKYYVILDSFIKKSVENKEVRLPSKWLVKRYLRHYELYFNIIDKYLKRSNDATHGFFMKLYVKDFWFKRDLLSFKNRLRQTSLNWSEAYSSFNNNGYEYTTVHRYVRLNNIKYIPSLDSYYVDKNKFLQRVNPFRKGLLIRTEFISGGSLFEKEDLFYINYLERKLIWNNLWLLLDLLFNNIKTYIKAYINLYKDFIDFFYKIYIKEINMIKWRRSIQQIKTSFFFRNFFNYIPDYIHYLYYYGIFILLFFLYSCIVIILISILKSFMPVKNIFSVKTLNKRKLKGVKNRFNKKYIKYNWYDLKISKIINKDFSKPEYIYKWVNLKNNKINKYFLKKKKVSTLQTKIRNQILKNYKIIYKKFIFEEKIRKLENNSKIRFNFKSWVYYYKYFKSKRNILYIIYIIFKTGYRDKKFNYSRNIVWLDSVLAELDEESKIEYYKIFNTQIITTIIFLYRFFRDLSKYILDSYLPQHRWKRWTWFQEGLEIDLNKLRVKADKNNRIEYLLSKSNQDISSLFMLAIELKKKFKDVKDKYFLKKTDFNLKNNIFNDIKKIESFYSKNIAKYNFKLKLKESIIKKKNLNEEVVNILQEDAIFKDSKLVAQNIKDFNFLYNYYLYPKIFREIQMDYILSYDPKVDALKKKEEWVMQSLRFKYADTVYLFKLEQIRKFYLRDKKNLKWTTTDNFQYLIDARQLATFNAKQHNLIRKKNYALGIIDPFLDQQDDAIYNLIGDYLKEVELKINELREKYYEEYWEKKLADAAKNAALSKEEREKNNLLEKKAKTHLKFIKLLYPNLKKFVVYLRNYTTIGGRFTYTFSLFCNISRIWINFLKKIKRDEHSFFNLIRISLSNWHHIIFKIYWDYILLSKNYEVFKKKGLDFLNILIFSLILLLPLFSYTLILYIIYIILYILLKPLYNFIIKLDFFHKKMLTLKIFKYIKNIFKKIFFIFKIFLTDIKTGESILDRLVILVYNFLRFIQVSIFFIKGGYKLGKQHGNWITGLQYSCRWIKLKFQSILEIQKEKISFKNLKKNWQLKIRVEILRSKVEFLFLHWIKNFHLKKWKFFIQYIISRYLKIFSKVDEKYYKKVIHKNFCYIQYIWKVDVIDKFNYYKKDKKEYKFFKKILLLSIIFFNIIKIPILFIINFIRLENLIIYKKSYIERLKIPKYSIIKNKYVPRASIRFEIHNALINNKISSFFNLMHHTISLPFEQIIVNRRNSPTNNMFYKRNREWVYKFFYKWKDKILELIYEYFYELEENYKVLEYMPLTKYWGLVKRFRYIWKIRKIKKYYQEDVYKIRLEFSRDLYLLDKKKIYNKYMRRYFIKGLINWLYYIYCRKVIYTEIKEIKGKVLKGSSLSKKRRFKYVMLKTTNISEDVYIGEHLRKVPPQLWMLAIMYDFYIKLMIRYNFVTGESPTERSFEIQYSQDFKWRIDLKAGENTAYGQHVIAHSMQYYNAWEFNKAMNVKPYDPLIRFTFYLAEVYGFREEFSEKETWGDVSLVFLNLFDDVNKKLKYFDEYDEYVGPKLSHEYLKSHWLIKKFIDEKGKLQDAPQRRALFFHDSLINIRRDDDVNELKNFWEAEKRFIFDLSDIEKHYDLTEERREFHASLDDDFYDFFCYTAKAKKDILNKRGNLEHLAFEIEYFVTHDNKYATIYHLLSTIEFSAYDLIIEDIVIYLKSNYIINNKNYIIKTSNIGLDENNEILSNGYKEFDNINWEDRAQETVVTIAKYRYKNEEFMRDRFDDFKYSQLELVKGYLNPMYITYNETIKNNPNISANWTQEDPSGWIINLLDEWFEITSKRALNSENFQREGWKIYMESPILYLQNVGWTLEQWLFLDVIEDERLKLLNYSLILLNERYRIYNIKTIPLRGKLPIALDQDQEVINNMIIWWREGGVQGEMYDNNYVFYNRFKPHVKSTLTFLAFKRKIEKLYNRDIGGVLIDAVKPKDDDLKKNEAERKRQAFLLEFLFKGTQYSNIWLDVAVKLSIEIIKYYYIWWGNDDDFNIGDYTNILLEEEIRKYPLTRNHIDLHERYIMYKYDPECYYNVFLVRRYFGKFFTFVSQCALTYFFYIVFYKAGVFGYNINWFIWPLVFVIIFWLSGRFLKKRRTIMAGRDLFLYKYQSFNIRPYNPKYWWWWTLSSSDNARVRSEMESPTSELFIKTHRSIYRRKKSANYAGLQTGFWGAIAFFFALQFQNYPYYFRHQFFVFDFWRPHLTQYMHFLDRRIDRTFYTKLHHLDTYYRFQNGGNFFTVWYENMYRFYINDPTRKTIDYGIKHYPIRYFHLRDEWEGNKIILTVKGRNGDGLYLSYDYWFNRYYKQEIAPKGRPKTWDQWFHNYGYKSSLFDDSSYLYHTNKHIWSTYHYQKSNFKDVLRFLLTDWEGPAFVLEKEDLRFLEKGIKNFLIDARNGTKTLILNDRSRYIENKYSGHSYITSDAYFKFKHNFYNILSERMWIIKRKALETGEVLDSWILVRMSEQEKHLNVLYYNFVKYKIRRYNYMIEHYKNNNLEIESLVEVRDKSEILSQKLEKYVINVFNNSSYEKKIEYKSKIIINFLKREKSWSFLDFLQFEEIIYNYDSKWELLDVIILVIKNFF